MATKNRPGFLQQAIKYYQRQSFRDSELIIVDDSDSSCANLLPKSSRFRHIRLPPHTILGEKLNIAIENSSGSIIQKLDDDDYYHPRFLETTVSTLVHRRHRDSVVAMGAFLVLIVGHPRLYSAGQGWFAGGTLCFRREAWNRKPFRHLSWREDVAFLEDHPELHKLPVSNPELYVLVRHGNHTWNTIQPELGTNPTDASHHQMNVTHYFSGCSPYHKTISEIMPAEDAQFYDDLCKLDDFSRIHPARILA